MDILTKIHINPSLDTPLVVQLKEQLIWLIASGQIKPGEHLPSARQAASHLGINLHTVRSAYHKLEASGLVEIRQGMTTRVLPYNTSHLQDFASTSTSHTVGVIIPSLTNQFYHPFLQGVEAVAKKSFTMLFICVTHDDPDEVQRSYAQLVAKNVDGILLVSQDDKPFRMHNPPTAEGQTNSLPLVVADWSGESRYSVIFDLENAGYLATRHLLEHGHQRIGLITYAIDLANVAPVNQGYHRALHKWGLTCDSDLIAPVHGFDISAGAEGARILLATKNPPTAIFAISDLLTIGAMRALQQTGFIVPKDLAIVGFNDIPMAEMVSPALTTVSAPAYQMGSRAMKMLRDLIVGKQPSVRYIVLPTSLVIRQSCGCQSTNNLYKEVFQS